MALRPGRTFETGRPGWAHRALRSDGRGTSRRDEGEDHQRDARHGLPPFTTTQWIRTVSCHDDWEAPDQRANALHPSPPGSGWLAFTTGCASDQGESMKALPEMTCIPVGHRASSAASQLSTQPV